MGIEEGHFSSEDGEQLFYRFEAGTAKKEVILLLHGHGEHSGRYLKFFPRLQDLGHPVAVFDLRGSGRSSGRRVWVSEFEDYLRDITSFIHFLKLRHEIATPLILFGHSLGGLMAAAWAQRNPEEVSKLILSSPLFGIPMAGAAKRLVSVLNRLSPKFVIENPVRPPYLTHDSEEVKKYREDPLIQRRITVRLVHEMLRWTDYFEKNELRVPFPVYILMAGEDHVVDPQATHRFFDRLEAPRKKLETFPGFYHEIFNESGQDQAFDRLRHHVHYCV